MLENKNAHGEHSMELIPVLDLLGGVVVHARGGAREHYRPIQTPLSESAEPQAVLSGLLRLHAFRTIYLADLDALMGRIGQSTRVVDLAIRFPHLRFWVDGGCAGLKNGAYPSNVTSIFGTESIGADDLAELTNCKEPFVLSLDYRNGELLGDPAVLQHPELWPERVILMSLSYVGQNQGPDFLRLEEFRRLHPRVALFAAGGVRHEEDLLRLQSLGVAGVLLASALHSGVLSFS
jgi:phosphoribosylformimino-5-aminoimidazole carboxamide ribotide isomerase